VATLVLDSTLLIQWARRPQPVVEWMRRAVLQGDTLVTTTINASECYAGAHESERPIWQEFFSSLPVWRPTLSESALAGSLKYDLARRGVGVALPDLIVGAVAVNRRALVATANIRDFRSAGVPTLLVDLG